MNLVLIVPLLAWFIAHLIKFISHAFRGDIDFRYFVGSGGVVSAHSAVVSALTTTVGLLEGVNSNLFAISFIVSSVIIYDSFGVRRAVGDHSSILAKVVEYNKLEKLQRIRPALGHTPNEVLKGVLLGTSLSVVFTYRTWTPKFGFLTESAGSLISSPEARVYFGFFIIAIFGWLIIRYRLNKKPIRKLASTKSLRSLVFWSIVPLSVLGLIFVWLTYEGISGYDYRLWQVLVILTLLITQLYLGTTAYPKLLSAIEQEKSKKKGPRSRRKRRK